MSISVAEYRQLAKKLRKYRNIPVEADGFKFDSKREARRYQELRLLERAGKIRNLEVHPKFDLAVNGELVGKYTGDFRYEDERGKSTTEDVKSKVTKTQAYRLRKRLMWILHRITVVEV